MPVIGRTSLCTHNQGFAAEDSRKPTWLRCAGAERTQWQWCCKSRHKRCTPSVLRSSDQERHGKICRKQHAKPVGRLSHNGNGWTRPLDRQMSAEINQFWDDWWLPFAKDRLWRGCCEVAITYTHLFRDPLKTWFRDPLKTWFHGFKKFGLIHSELF